MKRKPVETKIHILNVLSNQQLPVNGIIREMFKRTGSRNKIPLIRCLKTMGNDRLILEKRTKIHKQMRIKYLSPMGEELLDIIDSIHEYKKNLSALGELLKELIDLYNKHRNNGAIIRSILHQRGWKKRQAIKYSIAIEMVGNLVLICWNQLLGCLRLRLMSLASNNTHNNSLKELMDYIISDAIFFSIKLPPSEFIFGPDPTPFNKSDYSVESQKKDMLSQIIPMWIDLPESYFSVAKKLVASYLRLLKISRNQAASGLEQLQAYRRTQKVADTGDKPSLTAYDFDYLLAAFREYLQNSR